ncbi:MAG: hypothetical protein KF830_14245 [Planctomycetes bacterium]|nr:hypothetical protein [Planctomycetota bacterium]
MHPIRARCVAAALLGVTAVSPSLAAQSVFATHVVAFDTNGGAGGGTFAPANALGAPTGALGVHSLGAGGFLTLGFAVPIADGPGADFLVGENPFLLQNTFFASYAEVVFVEVSSDGVHFARFPARYFGAPASPGPFGSSAVGTYGGLAGQHPVLATQPGVDAQDVVEAGGDAFDLADLAGHPLVVGGLVDLAAITQVRLVDVVDGQALDAVGTVIHDAGLGSADIDAVTAIHRQGEVAANGPRVDLTIAVDGSIVVRIEDPDGWQDLDPASLRAALFGVPLAAGDVIGTFFQVQSADATGFTLVQPFPLPPELLFSLSFSVKDLAGHRSGAQRVRPTS